MYLDSTRASERSRSTRISPSCESPKSASTLKAANRAPSQEVRQHLGFATPLSRTRDIVLRTAPCLLGVFSLVCLIYHRHTRGRGTKPAQAPWYAKREASFADAIACVRLRLWWETVLQQPVHHEALQKLPTKLRETLLEQLSRGA